MPTNLAIDDNLLDEALRIGGCRTKRETVNEALKEYVMMDLGRPSDEELRRQGSSAPERRVIHRKGRYLGREGEILFSDREKGHFSTADIFEFLRPIDESAAPRREGPAR